MTVRKVQERPANARQQGALASRVNTLFLAGSAAAFGLALASLVPADLTAAVVSLLAFKAAVLTALVAYFLGVDRRAKGATLWDAAAVFGAIWVVTALLSKPEDIAQLFAHLTTAL
jgi:drug/metabolite transporter (DMT)-like permease